MPFFTAFLLSSLENLDKTANISKFFEAMDFYLLKFPSSKVLDYYSNYTEKDLNEYSAKQMKDIMGRDYFLLATDIISTYATNPDEDKVLRDALSPLNDRLTFTKFPISVTTIACHNLLLKFKENLSNKLKTFKEKDPNITSSILFINLFPLMLNDEVATIAQSLALFKYTLDHVITEIQEYISAHHTTNTMYTHLTLALDNVDEFEKFIETQTDYILKFETFILGLIDDYYINILPRKIISNKPNIYCVNNSNTLFKRETINNAYHASFKKAIDMINQLLARTKKISSPSALKYSADKLESTDRIDLLDDSHSIQKNLVKKVSVDFIKTYPSIFEKTGSYIDLYKFCYATVEELINQEISSFNNIT